MSSSIPRAAATMVVALLAIACSAATNPAPITPSPTASPVATSPQSAPSPTPPATPPAASATIASETWTATGSMVTPRNSHTATLLRDGTVLVAGGLSGDLVAQAELYDPGRGSWAGTGSMNAGRYGHTATLLPDGTVLVAGGSNNASSGGALATTEVYDPGTGTWTAAGTMIEARHGHTATMLLDGTVLVTGGFPSDAEEVSPINDTLAFAELYTPRSGSWNATPSMATGRAKHTATLLPDGRVLVARLGQLGSAELYDPRSGSWTVTGNMAAVRFVHTATLLPDGRVLVVGGYGNDGATARSAELYDPRSETWSPTADIATARYGHTATLLVDGRVLAAGGSTETSYALPSAELYGPRTTEASSR